jgi:Fungal specific transcription factor domain
VKISNAGTDFFRIAEPASNSPLSGQNVSFYPEITPAFGVFGQDTMPVNNRMSDRTPHLTDLNTPSPVSRKIYELVMQLTNTFITLPKGHHAKVTSSKIDQADSFFTSPNVQIFIQTYFHHFHPHFSVIHRPSFDIKTTSPRLLLAVSLAGSLYMSLSHDIGRGKGLLDLAEEFIFRDATLKRVAKGSSNNEVNDAANDAAGVCESSLEILQAAFIIVVLQNWEGNKAAQRRARVDRLQQLVSVRDIPPIFRWPDFGFG